ncbi:MAG: YgcG family protein [Rhodocyclaceae bacterium]|nr:YgcG family protein [Rhodocyclaceae bacterium]
MFRALVALLFAGWLAAAGAQDLQPVPALSARVTDLTATLSADERERLEARLAAFEQEKGAQLAVLLVPTTQPESIEQYAIRVAEAWKLGRQGVDDGVLLLVAKDDRKLRIEVGYGLEGALNDATAKRIVAETITPHFRDGRFYAGIDAGVGQILAVVDGEPLPPPAAHGGSDDLDVEDVLVLGLLLVTVVAGLLRAILGRFLGAVAVGGIAGLIVMVVVSSFALAALAGVVAFVLALVTGGRGGWGGGASGGSWGGGGFGGGGFSGGGGGFGGGGASGSW